MAAVSKLMFIIVAGLTLAILRLWHHADVKLPRWVALSVLGVCVTGLVGSLAGLVFLQYQAFAAPLWLYSNPVWHAAAGIGLHLVLAVLFGYLVHLAIHHLYVREKVTTVQAVALLTPTTFILLFALFATEARDFYERMSRVGFGGVVVDITEDRESTAKINIEQQPEALQSDFQNGIRLHHLAATRLRSDLQKIAELCATYGAGAPAVVTCEFGSAAGVPTVYFGPQLFDPKTFAAGRMLTRMILFLEKCVGPYADALVRFQRDFPNGVPIQDDLSEIASGYADLINDGSASDRERDDAPAAGTARCFEEEVPLGELAPEAPPADADEHTSPAAEPSATPFANVSDSFAFNLDRIRTILDNFARRYLKPGVDGDWSDLPASRDLLEGGRRAAGAEARFFEAAFDAVECDPNDVEAVGTRTRLEFPYRAMLRAGLLAAAGYPLEAAYHLDNSLMCFTSIVAPAEARGAAIHLPATVMKIRVLAELETLYQQAQQETRQLEALRRRLTVTERWMEWQLGADALDLGSLLTACAGRNWVQPVQPPLGEPEHGAFVSGIAAALDMDLAHAARGDGLEVFIRHHLSSYLSDLNRHYFFHASAADLIVQRDLEVAQSFAEVAVRRPELLDRCFDPVGFWDAGWADLTRVELVETSALLHAHRARQLSEARDTIDAADEITSDIRFHACAARDLLNWGLRLVDDMLVMGDSASHAEVYGKFDNAAEDKRRSMRRVRNAIRQAAENCDSVARPMAL